MDILHDCIFGEDCGLCKYFDYEGTCYCWLILVIVAIICIIMILIICLIAGKIKKNKLEEEIEAASYVKTYNELAKKQAEEKERQERLEAKENGEDGSEDILVELVKELTEEERINFGEVKFEAATRSDKVTNKVQIDFQKPRQKDEEAN